MLWSPRRISRSSTPSRRTVSSAPLHYPRRLLSSLRLRELHGANGCDQLTFTRVAYLHWVHTTQGNLDSRVLNTFRQSEIECLDLAASAGDDAGGLNLGAKDLLQGAFTPL